MGSAHCSRPRAACNGDAQAGEDEANQHALGPIESANTPYKPHANGVVGLSLPLDNGG